MSKAPATPAPTPGKPPPDLAKGGGKTVMWLLYGLAAVVQGILAAPLFLARASL